MQTFAVHKCLQVPTYVTLGRSHIVFKNQYVTKVKHPVCDLRMGGRSHIGFKMFSVGHQTDGDCTKRVVTILRDHTLENARKVALGFVDFGDDQHVSAKRHNKFLLFSFKLRPDVSVCAASCSVS